MTSFLAKYWKTLTVASVSIASSYFSTHHDESQINHRRLSVLTLQAAEFERRNAGISIPKQRYQTDGNYDDDDDDDGDNDEEKKDKDESDASITNIHEKRFREFSSIEYDDEIYMTPIDFLESLISDQPRPRIGRRHFTDDMVRSMLSKTPAKRHGSNRFFRKLEDTGLISFSEYLFLCVILTKPTTQFGIAFHMFDTNGNQLVDKTEFLMFDVTKQSDTSLLVHFFGKNGRDTLNYTDFKRFLENFQQEILEIEFNQFSHGFKTISDLDFTEMLLRYTNFPEETKKLILKRVKRTSAEPNQITFDQYKQFSFFLKNLDEFNVAMRFYQLSNKPISQAEFQRAVKISSGFELDLHIIGLIFRIFDADNDQHLSYEEFMSVMKDRLSRGFRTHDSSKKSISKFDQFKHCLRDRAKYNARAPFN